MVRRLFLFTLLIISHQLYGQDNFPLGWGNRDANKVVDVIGRQANYPVYYDKVFYQSSTGNSPSYNFPDYGTISFNIGGCWVGNKRMQWWVKYQVDYGSNMSTFTINPETEFGTKTVSVIAENYRKTSCTGSGTTTFQTVTTFTIKFEQPEWAGEINQIKTICNGIDKNFNLVDNFSAKQDVTFYLDNTSNPPITVFNPKGIAAGFHKLIAVKTYDNAIPDQQYGSRRGEVKFEYEFEVLPSAEITIGSYPASICQNAGSLTIKATPDGGSWDGNGIDEAGNFNPANAAIGRNIYKYRYNNANGCISEKTIEITVLAPPAVTVVDLNVCRFSAPFTLTVGQPTGGTYSGRGIVNGTTFDPGQAIVGNNVIKYSYTDPATGCTTEKEFTIKITDRSDFKVGEDFTTCTTVSEINLNDRTDVYPNDGSILWSGPGVINNKYFSPATAGVGIHTIKGTLYDPQTGCTFEKNFVIKVLQGTVVSAGADIVVCNTAAAFRISGGTPAGGTWTGDHTSNNIFTPPDAVPGDYYLTYTFNDGTCTVSDKKVITVVAPPHISAGNDFTVCRNQPPVKLPVASPAGGSWMPDGDYYNASDNTIDPAKMQVGSNKLVYTYGDGTCSVSDELEVTVLLPPVVNAGTDMVVCINANPVTLQGLPAGGIWTGPGVDNGRFDPARAGVGEHLLTYSYTDLTSTCSNTDNMYIKVLPAPVVIAGPNIIICKNSGDLLLTGADPVGGTWSGDFVVNGVFRTSIAPIGTYTISYAYSDGTCTTVATRQIQVIAAVIVNAGSDLAMCQGQTKQAPPVPSPAGGKWRALSGNFYDITDNTIDPGKMQLGDNFLIYTVTTGAGCTISDTMKIRLHARPVLTGMRDFTACANGANVPLVASPQGGIWEGEGVDNNQGSFFVPGDVAAKEHQLTYTYTDPATGCTTIDTVIAKVNTPPALQLPVDSAICIASPVFPLRAQPEGGTWTGSAGIVGNSFDAGRAGVGEHPLTYTYTDPATKCQAVKTIKYTVIGLPGPITISGDTLKCTGALVILSAAADNVKIFDWYRAGEAQPFATGPSISYTITKDEQLIAKPRPVNIGDCPGEGRIFSIVADSPTGTISNEGENDTLPFGGLFTATSQVKKTVSYRWEFGDGGYSTQGEGRHYFYKPGKYQVRLIATSKTGCETIFTLPDSIMVLDENGKIPEPDVDKGSGMDNNAFKANVFPTSFKNKLTVTFNTSRAQDVEYLFYDANGNLIHQEKRAAVNGPNKKTFENLYYLSASGAWYYLKINSQEIQGTYKIFRL